MNKKGHINSKIHVIYISSNNVRHPVAKTFTTLHLTQLHFTPLVYKRRRTMGLLIYVTTLYLLDNLHQIIVNQINVVSRLTKAVLIGYCYVSETMPTHATVTVIWGKLFLKSQHPRESVWH
jgi:hypothetical protein